MKKIIVITDNTFDLTQDIIEKEELVVIKIKAHIGDTDVTDMAPADVFALADKTKILPKTAAININEFDEVFEKYSKEGDVIYIGLGSGISSTFNSAFAASQSYDNVYVIDSQNLSSGIGLLVLKVCKYRAEGFSAQEIKEKVEQLVPKVRTQFAVNTLEYLHMGGRCSGVANFLGSVLNLKPIIKVINNKLEVAKKPVGFNKALKAMLDDVISKADQVDLDCITVTHCLASEDAKFLISKLSEKFDKNIIIETYASQIISAHCGPRCIGILYIEK